MGVYKLKNYIKKKKIGRIYELSKLSRIIIDGNSLLFYLHKQSNLPCHYGGEYKEFEAFIESFFSLFSHIDNEDMEVIFDGFPDYSKHDTLVSRRNEQATKSNKAWNHLKEKGKIANNDIPIPNFYKICLIETIKKLGIYCYHANQEGDELIARKAWQNQYDAILALDTDFLIYRTPGYMPLDTIVWKHKYSKNTFKVRKKNYYDDKYGKYKNWHRKKRRNASDSSDITNIDESYTESEPDNIYQDNDDIIPYGRLITNIDMCNFLDVNYKYLPIIASLTGNDIVLKDWVNDLHQKWNKDFFYYLVKWIKETKDPWEIALKNDPYKIERFWISCAKYSCSSPFTERNLKIDMNLWNKYRDCEISQDIIHILLTRSVRFSVPFQGIEYCFPEKLTRLRQRYYSTLVGNNVVKEYYWKLNIDVPEVVINKITPIKENSSIVELHTSNDNLPLTTFLDICCVPLKFIKGIIPMYHIILITIKVLCSNNIINMTDYDIDCLLYHIIYPFKWECTYLEKKNIDIEPLIIGQAYLSIIREILIINQICNKPIYHVKISDIYCGSLLLAIYRKDVKIIETELFKKLRKRLKMTF